jgi:hypothetical protein
VGVLMRGDSKGTIALAILIGLTGVVLHLDSRFFHDRTIKSLVYAAPFAAPLAYTGLGLLLIMNRMVDSESEEWPRWVILLGLGGFAGNFIFSLTDHAQNGFFHWTEWIPVWSSAFAIGFLTTIFATPITRRFLVLCAVVLLIQTIVVIAWITWNSWGPEGWKFDPWQFILLNLVFSTQAAYAAPLILLAETRQADRDREEAAEDRRRGAEVKADLDFLAREMASLRLRVVDSDDLARVEAKLDRLLAMKEPKDAKEAEPAT